MKKILFNILLNIKSKFHISILGTSYIISFQKEGLIEFKKRHENWAVPCPIFLSVGTARHGKRLRHGTGHGLGTARLKHSTARRVRVSQASARHGSPCPSFSSFGMTQLPDTIASVSCRAEVVPDTTRHARFWYSRCKCCPFNPINSGYSISIQNYLNIDIIWLDMN